MKKILVISMVAFLLAGFYNVFAQDDISKHPACPLCGKDAETFIGAHGGEIASFEEAIEAAYADMYQDNKMIRQKRKMMREKKMKKDN